MFRRFDFDMRDTPPIKPDRGAEIALHHRGVTAMLDEVLLVELRLTLRATDFAKAKQTAMQMAWRLHSLVELRR